MSRNNKNAKRLAKARELSVNRKNGSKESPKTHSTSKKKNAWWQKFPSYGAFIRGKKSSRRDEIDAPIEDALAV
jgi:hypothetical protein